MISSENWIPSSRNTGKEMEVNSLLGPFFRLTTFHDTAPSRAKRMFQGLGPNNSNAEVNALRESRLSITSVHRANAEMLMAMLKSSPQAREATLDWLATTLERNKDRSKYQVDPLTIASDGFMVNLTAALLSLCGPIMDPSGSKLGMIDPEYYVKTTRALTMADETRVVASAEAGREYDKKRRSELQDDAMNVDGAPSTKGSNKPNFVTECFFMTMEAMRLGTSRVFQRFESIMQAYSQHSSLYKSVRQSPITPKQSGELNKDWCFNPQLKERVPQWGTTETALAQQISGVEEELDKINSKRLCFQAMIMEPVFIQNVMRFINLAALLLVRTACVRVKFFATSSSMQDILIANKFDSEWGERAIPVSNSSERSVGEFAAKLL
jgi:ubiquitin conjugation factor E4 B